MLTIRDDDYIRLNFLSDFIEDFVAPSNRLRLHYLLSKPKRRRDVVHDLCYQSLLDERYLHRVGASYSDEIYAKMRELGAPELCFVISLADERRGETDLKTALEENFGLCTGIILYCRKEKLGYWEAHHCDRYILSKTANPLLHPRS